MFGARTCRFHPSLLQPNFPINSLKTASLSGHRLSGFNKGRKVCILEDREKFRAMVCLWHYWLSLKEVTKKLHAYSPRRASFDLCN